MLTSITPLGERGRRMNWAVTTAWFTGGTAVGGALTGAMFGALGSTLAPLDHPKWALFVLAIASALGLAVERAVLGVRLPSVKRQVDDQWLYRYRGWIYGSGFGFQLGLGFVTVVNTGMVYLAALICFLTGSLTVGACLGAAFGLARALPFLLVRHVRTWDDLVRVDQRHEALERKSELLASFILAGVAAVSLVGAAF